MGDETLAQQPEQATNHDTDGDPTSHEPKDRGGRRLGKLKITSRKKTGAIRRHHAIREHTATGGPFPWLNGSADQIVKSLDGLWVMPRCHQAS